MKITASAILLQASILEETLEELRALESTVSSAVMSFQRDMERILGSAHGAGNWVGPRAAAPAVPTPRPSRENTALPPAGPGDLSGPAFQGKASQLLEHNIVAGADEGNIRR